MFPNYAVRTVINAYSTSSRRQRVVDSALVAGGMVFFTTYTPNTNSACTAVDAYLYAVDYLCANLAIDPFSIPESATTGLELVDGVKKPSPITKLPGCARLCRSRNAQSSDSRFFRKIHFRANKRRPHP